MEQEKTVKVIKGREEKLYTYYIRKKFSNEFERDMYNVGIKSGEQVAEIEDFSPSEKEAEALCNYLYKENVTPDNLFLIAEEFIVTL